VVAPSAKPIPHAAELQQPLGSCRLYITVSPVAMAMLTSIARLSSGAVEIGSVVATTSMNIVFVLGVPPTVSVASTPARVVAPSSVNVTCSLMNRSLATTPLTGGATALTMMSPGSKTKLQL
jgi:hypothetical protein